MGIRRFLHSSFCFLNTNTTITRQLIRTARTLEAEWWQVCGEAWVRGQRKISQALGAFRLLDFTILRPVLAWRAFWNLWTVYFFNFPIFFRTVVNRGYGGPPVYWTSTRGQPTRGGPPAWSLGDVLTTPLRKTDYVMEHVTKPRTWTDPLVRCKFSQDRYRWRNIVNAVMNFPVP